MTSTLPAQRALFVRNVPRDFINRDWLEPFSYVLFPQADSLAWTTTTDYLKNFQQISSNETVRKNFMHIITALLPIALEVPFEKLKASLRNDVQIAEVLLSLRNIIQDKTIPAAMVKIMLGHALRFNLVTPQAKEATSIETLYDEALNILLLNARENQALVLGLLELIEPMLQSLQENDKSPLLQKCHDYQAMVCNIKPTQYKRIETPKPEPKPNTLERLIQTIAQILTRLFPCLRKKAKASQSYTATLSRLARKNKMRDENKPGVYTRVNEDSERAFNKADRFSRKSSHHLFGSYHRPTPPGDDCPSPAKENFSL